MKTATPPAAIPRAGFSIPGWCAAIGISRASFYNLPATQKPKTARIGRRCIVIERPEDFLARIAEAA